MQERRQELVKALQQTLAYCAMYFPESDDNTLVMGTLSAAIVDLESALLKAVLAPSKWLGFFCAPGYAEGGQGSLESTG